MHNAFLCDKYPWLQLAIRSLKEWITYLKGNKGVLMRFRMQFNFYYCDERLVVRRGSCAAGRRSAARPAVHAKRRRIAPSAAPHKHCAAAYRGGGQDRPPQRPLAPRNSLINLSKRQAGAGRLHAGQGRPALLTCLTSMFKSRINVYMCMYVYTFCIDLYI